MNFRSIKRYQYSLHELLVKIMNTVNIFKQIINNEKNKINYNLKKKK